MTPADEAFMDRAVTMRYCNARHAMFAEVIQLFADNQKTFLQQATSSIAQNQKIADGMEEFGTKLDGKIEALISAVNILDHSLRGEGGYFAKIDKMHFDYQRLVGFFVITGKLLSYTVAFSIIGGALWVLFRWLLHL